MVAPGGPRPLVPFTTTPYETRAAVMLWAASWHQIPAASVPNDEKWLAKAAGYMTSYWLIVVLLGYLLFYGVAGCKNVNTDIPVDEE